MTKSNKNRKRRSTAKQQAEQRLKSALSTTKGYLTKQSNKWGQDFSNRLPKARTGLKTAKQIESYITQLENFRTLPSQRKALLGDVRYGIEEELKYVQKKLQVARSERLKEIRSINEENKQKGIKPISEITGINHLQYDNPFSKENKEVRKHLIRNLMNLAKRFKEGEFSPREYAFRRNTQSKENFEDTVYFDYNDSHKKIISPIIENMTSREWLDFSTRYHHLLDRWFYPSKGQDETKIKESGKSVIEALTDMGYINKEGK